MSLSYYVGNLPSEGHKKAKRREEKAAAKKESMANKMKFNPKNPHHQDLMDEAREAQREHRSRNNE